VWGAGRCVKETGPRQYGDFPGAWGWIRLLDKAVVSAYPGTSSSWSLSWKAPDGLLLNYTLRTEAGEGPPPPPHPTLPTIPPAPPPPHPPP
ncbi:type VI secretion IcmF C-terminal domain-containing protein, partial [Klebsiella pneumoniae]|uniref:type VI secretion IcmF C-terminal domain-containing protein n=1 Tax=Klebsiella pneumoniae TaxID=573 RepID=UPI00273035B9